MIPLSQQPQAVILTAAALLNTGSESFVKVRIGRSFFISTASLWKYSLASLLCDSVMSISIAHLSVDQSG